MSPSPYLVTYRKRRRRGRSLVVWLSVLAVAAAVGTAVVNVAPGRSNAAATLPAASQPATPSVQPSVQPASKPRTATATPEPKAATSTPEPDVVAPEAQPEAVTRAAVDYPGAPAVKPRSISRLRPKHKYIAITFDDGYGFDSEMLELLLDYDARCTTFVVGDWASRNKKTLRRLDKAGFEIANHTWGHKDLTELSDSQVRSELRRTQKVISKVTGNQAPYMRPPMGATNSDVKRLSAELGYTVVMWNRTFADSSSKASAERAYRSVMERDGGVRPGDIIVCHWGSEATYGALKRILPELKEQGYEFVTLSELIADSKDH